MSAKHKTIIIICCTVAVLLVALGIGGFNLLISNRNENIESNVSENFKSYAAAQALHINPAPALKNKLDELDIAGAQYVKDAGSVEVYIRLPRIGTLISAPVPVSGPVTVTDEPDEYIYKCIIPVNTSLRGYDIKWEDSNYMQAVYLPYVQLYCSILMKQLNETEPENALLQYLFPAPQAAQNPADNRLRFMYNPAAVKFTVGDYGETYLNIVSYNNLSLIQYTLQKLFTSYSNKFLTEKILPQKLEEEFSALLFTYSDALRDMYIAKPETSAANHLLVELQQVPYEFSIAGNISDEDFYRGLDAIRDDYLSKSVYYSEKLDNALTTLLAQTDSMPVYVPEPEPETGLLLGESSGYTLTVENNPGFGAYYVLLIPARQDDEPDTIGTGGHFGIYLRDGETFTFGLPAGTYNVKYASGNGDTWYGTFLLFGPSGRYTVLTEAIEIDAGSFLLTLNSGDTGSGLIGEKYITYSEWD